MNITLEELEFLRCISDDETIFKTYEQLKLEGRTDNDIIDYLEHCYIAASSHEGL